jgi:hypothetical protein
MMVEDQQEYQAPRQAIFADSFEALIFNNYFEPN